MSGKTDPYISLWAPIGEDSDSDETNAIRVALQELDAAIAEEDSTAARFSLEAGEALIVDNFRMLHARESFRDCSRQRRMWRVWSWTNAAMGLPLEMKGNSLPANILDAENAILETKSRGGSCSTNGRGIQVGCQPSLF